jgi:hypothetical protein
MADKKEQASAPAEDKEGTSLATAQSTALSTDSFFEGAGEGMEDFSQRDFTVPFISIIQALSKATQKTHANFVKGAEQGQFLNSATRMLYDGEKGLIVVPAFFQHRYIAWKPNNGGIAHDYGSSPDIFDGITPVADGKDKGKRFDPEGNEVVDALEYFVLLIDPEALTIEAAVIPFSGTHSGRGRKWNNLIRAHAEVRNGKPVKPAIYFYSYKMTTTPVSNDKGSWYTFQIEDYKKLPDLGDFGAQVFHAAAELRKSVASGEIKAATAEPEATSDGDGDGAF